jgi:hypothetical protein
MSHRNPNTAHLVLRLCREDLEIIDAVAAAFNLTRTSYLRKCIFRGLAYSKACELPLVQTPEVQAALCKIGRTS